ncbi:MAG: uroporphyrinogen decarboxylase family protein [Prolixibacteraceae bacterium]
MRNSFQLVRNFIENKPAESILLYDLLRNDAIVSHFGGAQLNPDNGRKVVFNSYEPAIDATRPLVRFPNEEKTIQLDDGRTQKFFRWTIWTSHVHFENETVYQKAKEKFVGDFEFWNREKQDSLNAQLVQHRLEQKELGEVYHFPVGPCNWLTRIYDEVGLEDFSFYWAYFPELIDHILECHMQETIAWAEHLPEDFEYNAVFLADDIAFQTGTLLPPQWFNESYFHLLQKVCAAFHKRNIKVLFHSDGNLNPILADLVSAGIDGLNPIEVMAGMDVADIHKKFPYLFLAGGIDVSQLLPFGKPQEIKDVVKKTIEDAEGRIMIGSTTEVHDEVPLKNFLAMREAVLEYKL